MPTTPRRRASSARTPEKLAGISSAAVARATGKTWPEWIAALDAGAAIKLPHANIASHLRQEFKLPGWWSQLVTVGYEQAHGRRVVGQTCTGDYAANASKTLPLSAVQAHAWMADPRKRARWLEQSITLRSATVPKSARLQFPDGSIAGVWITAKRDDKCSVGISHDHLPDAKTAAKHKAFWATALNRLAALATA